LHGFIGKTGIKDVTYKLYKDARHELVNELNRDEVINDIIMWMNKRNPFRLKIKIKIQPSYHCYL